MAKETEIVLVNNFYDNNVLKDSYEHNKKIEYTRKASGGNTIVDTDLVKTIDFEGITAKVLYFKNIGDGVISYTLSGAVANTGTLETGGILAIHNGNVTGLTIETTSIAPIGYEYIILG
jgi:hypothetical protein